MHLVAPSQNEMVRPPVRPSVSSPLTIPETMSDSQPPPIRGCRQSAAVILAAPADLSSSNINIESWLSASISTGPWCEGGADDKLAWGRDGGMNTKKGAEGWERGQTERALKAP